MYAQENGECTIDGQTIYVMTFADTNARDQWMKVAKTMGAGGSFADGDLWVLQGDDRDAVAKGAQAAGGKLL
jgi:hypothetical protein